jgi:[protein-PII] uridylyltransferase
MNVSIERFKTALHHSRAARFGDGESGRTPFQRVASFTADVDRILTDIFTTYVVGEKSDLPVCLVALGGYGRAELCPYSDIDLLVLHDCAAVPSSIEAAIRLFWDIGLSMSCVVRTIDECATILGEDLATDTSFLEGRFLSGDRTLFTRLVKNCIEPYFLKKKKQFTAELRSILKEELYSPEHALYLVEPDVKNGICTLRDCQRLLWAERVSTGAASIGELRIKGGFSEKESKLFFADYEFLIGLRSALHGLCGRRMDVLEIALQPEVALRCGFSSGGAGALMERFYRTVRSIRLFLLSYVEKWPSDSGLWTALRKRVGALDAAPHVRMSEGILFSSGKIAGHRLDAAWIMTVFRQALRLGATLSVEMRNTVRTAAAALSSDDFRSQRVNKLFGDILSFDGRIGHVVQLMHETGVLARLIPQFEDLVCKVEYDSYHEFTVDQHLLLTIPTAEDLTPSLDGAVATAYSQCSAKMVLRLALLLHDIGKALSGDHVVNGAIIVEPICERLGLDGEGVRRVRTLIYHHLDMAELSLHRAPGDRPLMEFSRRIGDRANLDMLYVLTAIDIRCVGHGTWTAWKAYQLEQLYKDLLPMFGVGAGVLSERAKFDAADDAYERDVLPEDRQLHSVWLGNLPGDGLGMHLDKFSGFERLTVCGWDRMGLLRDIIGCISSEGFNILSAHLFSMASGSVVDIFYVEPPRFPSIASEQRIRNMEKKWQDIQTGIASADSLVADRQKNYPLKRLRSARMVKPHVTAEASSPDAATVLKIKTADNFGVLHKIVQCLGKNGANVRSAHLSTRGELAYDIFYITDAAKRKLDPKKLHQICRDITEALQPAPDS